MTQRAYQQKWKADIREAWGAGHHNVLAVLPTGGGKSFGTSGEIAGVVHDTPDAEPGVIAGAVHYQMDATSSIPENAFNHKLSSPIAGANIGAGACVYGHPVPGPQLVL